MRPRRLSRSPAAYWLLAAAAAAATGMTIASLVGDAAGEAARYGAVRAALVTRRAVAAGERLAPGDVEVRRVPAAFLPDGALGSLPPGRTALVELVAGQFVAAAHLAPDGVAGVAALVPPGTRGVAVPTGGVAPRLRRGDLVDVLVVVGDGPGGAALTAAEAALVLDVDGETVTVAVPAADAPGLALAMASGPATLALVPHG